MPDFHRAFVDSDNFIRGAARLLWAGITIAFPTSISSVINLSLYDPTANWNELGATKTGVQISVNNTEETFDVDQIYGDIDSQPTNWEVTIQTALAEMTLARLGLAWMGNTTTTDTAPSPDETVLGLGLPQFYIQRRLVVLHQRANGRIRMFAFRKVQRTPQESTISYSKTGEQQTAAVRFRCLADTSVADPNARFGEIRDQLATG